MIAFLPPYTLDSSRIWLSVNQVAQRWNRTPRHIRRWCEDGTLVGMGARVYRDNNRWWIGLMPMDVPDMAVPTI